MVIIINYYLLIIIIYLFIKHQQVMEVYGLLP